MMKTDFSTKKIIIAQDTSFMRTGLVKILIEIGFKDTNIFAYENGKQAFDQLKNHPARFDIILSDWNMPRLTGLEFLKSVRSSQEYFKHIPFILFTTVSEKEKVVEALNYQVSAYILKPIQIQKLKDSLDFVLKVEGKTDE